MYKYKVLSINSLIINCTGLKYWNKQFYHIYKFRGGEITIILLTLYVDQVQRLINATWTDK